VALNSRVITERAKGIRAERMRGTAGITRGARPDQPRQRA
jgi:hypothetical protein